MSEVKRCNKPELIIKIEINAEADKKLVVVKKLADKKAARQFKLSFKRFLKIISFDFVVPVFKNHLTRTDKSKKKQH